MQQDDHMIDAVIDIMRRDITVAIVHRYRRLQASRTSLSAARGLLETFRHGTWNNTSRIGSSCWAGSATLPAQGALPHRAALADAAACCIPYDLGYSRTLSF
jgi:hypothetical protein